MSPKEYKPGTTFSGETGSQQNSRVATMEDVIPAFFEAVAGPHPAAPKTISGSLRFDLGNGNRTDHWRVTFAKGIVSTARSNDAADCIVHTDKATMEAIIQGRVNAMAALLRGAMKVEGQVLLLALFRSLFTTPAAKPVAQRVGRNTGRRS